MRRTALIVGSGIGGLSAAIALWQAGWNVRIHERAASKRELGFGLLLAPNAMAALGRLGVAGAVLGQGFAPTLGEVRRMDGTLLKRVEFPSPEVMGGPTVVALRPALFDVWLAAVPSDALQLGSEVTEFRETPGRVVLQTTGGDDEGDLLVGADGVGSVVRRLLHPLQQPPRSSGIIAVRGIAWDAIGRLGPLSGIYYLGPGVESFLARASDTRIYWALSLARELVPEETRDPAEILALMSPRFDADFRAVTSATEEMRCDELVDREPLPFWGEGAVTLLGDAAHPLLPHTGQGAAQAIVDAVSLARALGRDARLGDALRSYERERLQKTAILVGQGRRTAAMMRTTNPVLCRIGEELLRRLPATFLLKLFARLNRRAGTASVPR